MERVALPTALADLLEEITGKACFDFLFLRNYVLLVNVRVYSDG